MAKSLLYQAIVDGNMPQAVSETRSLIAAENSPQSLLEAHLIPAMAEVGKRFETNEYFVPELLMAARAMQESMKILNPLLVASGVAKIGRVVIGTVKGDLHDIGKNIVASMMEGGGFEVIDLGVDVSTEKFITAAQQSSGKVIVALSALLTTTMPQMRGVIEALNAAGMREQVKVIIGGAPVTDGFAREIGADGYSNNASQAVTLAKQLLA